MKLKKIFYSNRHRLIDELKELEYRIDTEYKTDQELSIDNRKTIQKIEKILGLAKEAIKDNKTELAWRLLHCGQRYEIDLYNNFQLKVATSALFFEANRKLKDWRKDTVIGQVGEDGKPRTKSDKDTLRSCYKILHRHFDNDSYKKIITQKQLFILSIISVIAISTFWYLSSDLNLFENITTETYSKARIEIFSSILLFGIMGACLSGLYSLARNTESLKIPKVQMNAMITFSRPLIGAISALVIFVFLISDILNVIPELKMAAVFAVCFVSGFSERLVIKATKLVTP